MKKSLFQIVLILFSAFIMLSCSTDSTNDVDEDSNSQYHTYLALGDSYTIGEGVDRSQRWPEQLVKKLEESGLDFNDPKIIAKTGWTTKNLLSAMNVELTTNQYDLVSISIGVNNQYQRRSINEYEEDLKVIFSKAINRSVNGKEGVFVLSIPDYGATPFGASNSENIGKDIARFNSVLKRVSEDFDVPFYNITPISKEARDDLSLVANDGLHPSGKMYRLWVDYFFNEIYNTLMKSAE
ncbi:Lysophospholipase L1 [Gillisia sp. Hel1_33_143]|uniref:SGNH/GDSL hydrolase family protein n=1 Tax=Gillisia sp. Hel1_33_143 TaxID=1336796 RepID=UPI00087C171B|nr:SGNH/GDSL hydrolase family protein [Gillisia sp. Hel1_33_143]SDS28389.1 Lysophospholipase L1 [Gillisia sp. Hel1_33_143]